MASETFFEDGQRVQFAKYWCKGEEHGDAWLTLTGVITGCDDSSRECTHYTVLWDATEEYLESIGIDPTDSIQSDALVKQRRPKGQSKRLRLGTHVYDPKLNVHGIVVKVEKGTSIIDHGTITLWLMDEQGNEKGGSEYYCEWGWATYLQVIKEP